MRDRKAGPARRSPIFAALPNSRTCKIGHLIHSVSKLYQEMFVQCSANPHLTIHW